MIQLPYLHEAQRVALLAQIQFWSHLFARCWTEKKVGKEKNVCILCSLLSSELSLPIALYKHYFCSSAFFAGFRHNICAGKTTIIAHTAASCRLWSRYHSGWKSLKSWTTRAIKPLSHKISHKSRTSRNTHETQLAYKQECNTMYFCLWLKQTMKISITKTGWHLLMNEVDSSTERGHKKKGNDAAMAKVYAQNTTPPFTHK